MLIGGWGSGRLRWVTLLQGHSSFTEPEGPFLSVDIIFMYSSQLRVFEVCLHLNTPLNTTGTCHLVECTQYGPLLRAFLICPICWVLVRTVPVSGCGTIHPLLRSRLSFLLISFFRMDWIQQRIKAFFFSLWGNSSLVRQFAKRNTNTQLKFHIEF